jgi:hypothetical protein
MMTTWRKPAQLAKEWAVGVRKVHDFIDSGELVAVNFATSTSTRPRWLISQEAIDAFIAARQSRPATPAPARARKRAGGKEYV